MALLYLAPDHSMGHMLFRVRPFLPDGEGFGSFGRFGGIVELVAFSKWGSCNLSQALARTSAGVASNSLCAFLTSNLPEAGKAEGCMLGVFDPKLGASIEEKLGVACEHSQAVIDIILGLEAQFVALHIGMCF